MVGFIASVHQLACGCKYIEFVHDCSDLNCSSNLVMILVIEISSLEQKTFSQDFRLGRNFSDRFGFFGAFIIYALPYIEHPAYNL